MKTKGLSMGTREVIGNLHTRATAQFVIVSLSLLLMVGLAVQPEAAESDTAPMVLPSETCRGMFFVAVTVGADNPVTLNLLFDTGAQWTFIDPEALRPIIGEPEGVGKLEFKHARIGQHKLGPLKAYVYSMETLGLAIGRRFDGILGFPAFKETLLTLDYPAEEITVSSGRLPSPDEREIFRYYGYKRPFLKVDVGGRRVKVLLDSGSAGRLKLRSTDRFEWSVAPRTVGASVMFASTVLRRAGRMQGDIQFGPLTFESPVVALIDDERFAGWHLLHHFILTFDQKKKRVRMQADATTAGRMAPLVGSGVAFRPRPEGLEILNVLPGWSGAAAGLREGDLIVAVDGTPVHERGCRDPLGDPPGQREVWSYVREGNRADVEITTEALIP